jgi:hypothetical protein
MTGQEYIEAFRMEGMEKLIARLLERRLKRPLTTVERAHLHGRVSVLGAEHVGGLVVDLDPDALAAWLGETADADAA